MANLAASSLIAWLEVESGEMAGQRVPLVHVDLTFTLDRVAEAGLTLAVGYNPARARRNRQSSAHRLISQVDQNLEVKVILRGVGDMLVDGQGRTIRWPPGEITIFRGRTTGSGYQSFRGRYHHTISVSHWMGDLDEGSLLSDVFTRGSIQNNLLKISSGDGSGLISAAMLRSIASENGLNKDGGFELYDKGLRPMFERMMGQDEQTPTSSYYDLVRKVNSIAPGSAISRAVEGDLQRIHSGNTTALEVLRKINDDDKNIVPGDLTIPHTGFQRTRSQIIEIIANSLANNAGSGSALNLLLTIGQSFLFRLVSNVEAIAAAPVVPVWDKSKVWRELPGSELLSVQGRRAGNTRISTVAMIRQEATTDEGNTDLQAAGIAGAFVGQREGSVKLVQSPPWLHTPYLTDAELEQFANGEPPEDDASGETNGSRLEVLEIGCRWAKHQWAHAAYRGRSLNISSPFRLDIAPGSALAVQGMVLDDDRVSPGESVLYGNVGQVRLIIDGSKPSAVSQYSLTHVRSSKEEDQALTEHPIYEQAWWGSPLVKLRSSDLEPQR